jgi:hypothetical protein
MTDIATTAAHATRLRRFTESVPSVDGPSEARRLLQLALAGIWLLDAALQFQPFMFTKAFGQMLAATASGNPGVIAGPITWDASLVESHTIALNAIFAVTQLLLAAGIVWRRTLRLALAASVAWSLGVWWFGEGLGGVLAGNANPVTGAPGAVLIYALLAVLLWPADRPARGAGNPAPFTAARAVGPNTARALWYVLWLGLANLALLPANRAPQALQNAIAGLESGEPGWLAAIERHAAALAGNHGVAISIALAIALALIAAAVYLPAPVTRAILIAAIVLAAAIWVVGEAFGGILAGGATDPNSGPLLILLALAYWPANLRLRQVPGQAAVDTMPFSVV